MTQLGTHHKGEEAMQLVSGSPGILTRQEATWRESSHQTVTREKMHTVSGPSVQLSSQQHLGPSAGHMLSILDVHPVGSPDVQSPSQHPTSAFWEAEGE